MRAQVFLQCVAQCVHTYVGAATGAVAQGVQAAGIDIALPRKIGLLIAFVEQVASFGGFSPALLQQHVPPFLADAWLSVLQ